MRLVGLTGGMAAGKTTVSTMLAEAGFPVIDCDGIARDVVRKVRPLARSMVRSASTDHSAINKRKLIITGKPRAGELGMAPGGQGVPRSANSPGRR
jgi:dephospho-CoA kinase